MDIAIRDAAAPTAPDPFACYAIPYGIIGFLSDLVSIYMIVCLATSRAPLYPKRLIKHAGTVGICWPCWVLIPALANGINIHRCSKNGMWPLAMIAAGKIVLGPLFGSGVLVLAAKNTPKNKKAQSEAAGGVAGETRAAQRETDLETGRTREAAGGRSYWDAAVQVGDGVAHMLGDYLPSYSEVDPLLEYNELSERNVGIESPPSPSASPTRNQSSLGKVHKGVPVDGSSHHQKADGPVGEADMKPEPLSASSPSSPTITHSEAAQTLPGVQSLPEETRNGTASQPQLNSTTKAEGEMLALGQLILFVVIAGPLFCMLMGNIVLGVRSVASGKSGPWIVGLIFLALFLLFLGYVLVTAWTGFSKAMKREINVTKALEKANVHGAASALLMFFGLLIILYGDLNIGIASGRVLGLPPVAAYEAAEYWTYFGTSKLPLLCF